jgi:general secretion pathway protein D
MLPPLSNGQPPAGGAMAGMPPPAPVAPRPGQATGPGTAQPGQPGAAQPAQPVPGVGEFRPVQPTQQQ